MDTDAYLAHLGTAAAHYVRHARTAGLDTAVPTCPDWTVRQLTGHLGRVHRWAAALVRGEAEDHPTTTDPGGVEKQGRSAPDPLEWFQTGAVDVARSIARAPADVEVKVILADPRPPREFWARRQAHETTMHAVDALAASFGRLPTAQETWIGEELAVDGIDELLTGFLPREKTRLRHAGGTRVGVRTTGSNRAWLVEVSTEPPMTTRVSPDEAGAADHMVEGDPVAVYLALWHRSDEIDSTAWPLWAASAV